MFKQFIMCKGLPASGKSTWAETLVIASPPGEAVRVNKDQLRVMLHAGRYAGEATEKLTINARDRLISAMMFAGVPTIICDDTNLDSGCEKTFRGMCDQFLYEFEIRDFTDVDVDVCIARDGRRPKSVGEDVIRRMRNKYLWVH